MTQMPNSKSKKKPTKSLRKVQTSDYKSFKFSKKIKHPGLKLSSPISLFKNSIQLLVNNKTVFLGILGVYLVLTLVFVKGAILSTNTTQFQQLINDTIVSRANLAESVQLFGVLADNAGRTQGGEAALYQLIFLILFSLIFIYALRKIYDGKKITLKEAFYKSTYPLIPFVLVLIVFALQLLPMMVGGAVYGTIIANDLAINFLEIAMWSLLFFTLSTLSLYMIISSIFSLYVTTLDNVAPMAALRSARQLVLNRRMSILWRLVFLVLTLLAILILVVIPFIIFMPGLAPAVFFILTILFFGITHSYMYNLYRELLTR
jgi:hypothetical protein